LTPTVQQGSPKPEQPLMTVLEQKVGTFRPNTLKENDLKPAGSLSIHGGPTGVVPLVAFRELAPLPLIRGRVGQWRTKAPLSFATEFSGDGRDGCIHVDRGIELA
jgi:hypothetical protein